MRCGRAGLSCRLTALSRRLPLTYTASFVVRREFQIETGHVGFQQQVDQRPGAEQPETQVNGAVFLLALEVHRFEVPESLFVAVHGAPISSGEVVAGHDLVHASAGIGAAQQGVYDRAVPVERRRNMARAAVEPCAQIVQHFMDQRTALVAQHEGVDRREQVSFFLEYAAELIMGSGAKVIPSYYAAKTFMIGKVPLGLTSIITLVVTVLSMLVLTFLVQKTKLGKAMRAVSEDMDAARLMGINVNSTISFTFAVGSALAGIGAVLYCCSYPQATPTMGSMLGLKAFVAAVLGGIGSIPGAMIGGIAIGLCECFVSAIGLSAWKDAVTFAILIVVLLVKPTGFLGRQVQEKV